MLTHFFCGAEVEKMTIYAAEKDKYLYSQDCPDRERVMDRDSGYLGDKIGSTFILEIPVIINHVAMAKKSPESPEESK